MLWECKQISKWQCYVLTNGECDLLWEASVFLTYLVLGCSCSSLLRIILVDLVCTEWVAAYLTEKATLWTPMGKGLPSAQILLSVQWVLVSANPTGKKVGIILLFYQHIRIKGMRSWISNKKIVFIQMLWQSYISWLDLEKIEQWAGNLGMCITIPAVLLTKLFS